MKSKRKEQKVEKVKFKLAKPSEKREFFKQLLRECALSLGDKAMASREQLLEVLVEAICRKVGDDSEDFKNYLYFLIESDPVLEQSLLESLIK